jgi:DnaJ family protein A protein 5
LAKFVRKRDPRYKAFLARPAERSQSQTSGSATPVRGISNKRPQVIEEYVEQDWQKVDTSNMHADMDWATAEGDDPEEWECVACRKSFRSEAAWDSHERSKKHMKEVERLRREMLEQDEDLGLNGEEEEEEEMEQRIEMLDVVDPLPPTPPLAAVSVTAADNPSISLTDSFGVSSESTESEAWDDLSGGAQKSDKKSSKTPTEPKPLPKTQRTGTRVSRVEELKTQNAEPLKDLSDVATIPLDGDVGDTPNRASVTRDGSVLGNIDDVVDVPQPAVGNPATGTPAELTKREKRRARQAKKVEAGRVPGNEVTQFDFVAPLLFCI